MGLYDELRCYWPLPVDGLSDRIFQTKDLECELDLYEIRDDGTLWRQCIRYKADEGGNDIPVTTFARESEFTGEVRFYDFWKHRPVNVAAAGWIEFSAYFVRGELQSLNLFRDTPAIESKEIHQ